MRVCVCACVRACLCECVPACVYHIHTRTHTPTTDLSRDTSPVVSPLSMAARTTPYILTGTYILWRVNSAWRLAHRRFVLLRTKMMKSRGSSRKKIKQKPPIDPRTICPGETPPAKKTTIE